jgi:capsule polysaccharide export protein KpsE/RkpR
MERPPEISSTQPEEEEALLLSALLPVIQGLHQSLLNINSRLDRFESTIAQLESRIGGLNGGEESLRAEIERVKKDLDQGREAGMDLKKLIDQTTSGSSDVDINDGESIPITIPPVIMDSSAT